MRTIASVVTLVLAAVAVVFASFYPTAAVLFALLSAGLSFFLVRNSRGFPKLAGSTALIISAAVLVFETAVVVLSLST